MILPLIAFPKIVELNLSQYPLVSFYVSAESTPIRLFEDGVSVNFWYGKREDGFISDLDIVIALDTSGSMRKVIGFLDDLMAVTLNTLQSKGIRIRTGMLTFTDEILRIYPLTANASQCIGWLQDVIPFGGGDDNELSLDALLEASKFDFDPHARKVVLLITNAPPHHADDGSGFSDLTIQKVQDALSTKDINLIIIGPSIEEFKSFEVESRAQVFNINVLKEIEEAFNTALTTFFKSYLLEYRTPNFDFNRDHFIEVELQNGLRFSTVYRSPEKVNSPPIINSLSVVPPVSFPGESVQISVEARDIDGDSLRYRWKLNDTLLTKEGKEIVLTLDSTGTFTVACEVSDGISSSIARTGFRIIDKPEPKTVEKIVERIIKYETQANVNVSDLSTIEKNLGVKFSSTLFTDVDGDGQQEILAGTDSEGRGTLYMFNAMGQLIWNVILADDSVFWPDNSFSIEAIRCGDVDDDGNKEIVVLLNHVPWFPAIIAVVSADGIVKGKYYHPGHIKSLKLEDIEGDGIVDILFAGENAEYDFTTVVGVIDGRKLYGQAEPYLGLGVPPAKEKFYSRLPEASGVSSIIVDGEKIFLIDERGQRFEISN